MDSIFQIIKSYEDDFDTKSVQIVEGYSFDQMDTIEKIHRHWHSQFEDGKDDEQGEKYFHNILIHRARNVTKNIELDTKDIRIRTVNGRAYTKTWLYRRKLLNWMRKHNFGKTMNQMEEQLPVFGHVVVKQVPGEEIVEVVDIRNFKCDPTAKSLEHSWIVESHYYTPSELLAMRGKWDTDAVEEAVRSFKTSRKENYVAQQVQIAEKMGHAQYILVKEFYGDIERGLVEDSGSEEYVRARFIVVMPDDADSAENKESNRQGLVLERRIIKESPYKDLPLYKVPGRWLGKGVFEEGFELQAMKNEQINAVMAAIRLSSLILFQTKDETIARNLLTDLLNGDILKVKSDIQRIDTRFTDTTTQTLLSQEIERLADQVTNAFEVTTGGTLPSGTPFSLGALMNQNANKLFEFVREQYGLFLEEIITDWVLPRIEKEMTAKGILEIVDDEEIAVVRRELVRGKTWDSIKRIILNGERRPTVAEVQFMQGAIQQQMESKDSLFIDIAEGDLDFEKTIEVITTGEQVDPLQVQALPQIFQIINQNPAVIDHPLFRKMLDQVGFSVADLEGMPKQPMQPAQPAEKPLALVAQPA